MELGSSGAETVETNVRHVSSEQETHHVEASLDQGHVRGPVLVQYHIHGSSTTTTGSRGVIIIVIVVHARHGTSLATHFTQSRRFD